MRENLFKVYFFGDSICVGQGVSVHKGWVTRISSALSELSPSLVDDILFSNVSVNGNTSRLALERMPYDIQSHEPDLLIVQFGMNDCNFWQSDRGNPRVSSKAFEANLEEIIRRAYSFNVKKVFLNTNHPTTRTEEKMPFSDLTYQQSNESYNHIIRRVAEADKRVILNDIEKVFKDYAENNEKALENLVLPDRLHLSERGHDLYFETVYPKIKAAIFELLALSKGQGEGLVV